MLSLDINVGCIDTADGKLCADTHISDLLGMKAFRDLQPAIENEGWKQYFIGICDFLGKKFYVGLYLYRDRLVGMRLQPTAEEGARPFDMALSDKRHGRCGIALRGGMSYEAP